MLRSVVGAIALFSLAVAAPAAGYDFEDVSKQAEELAKQSYRDPRGRVPDWLLKITYDQWRDIRFRPDRTLWLDRKGPFQVQFFHPGLYYDRPVVVNVVEQDGVRPIEFSPSQFDYGKNEFASQVPQDLGYAGFRLHFPIKTPKYHDEVIVFLGASYLRAVGRNQGFGASARGLAVNTATSSGEEFPYFKEYWLVTPARDAKEMTVYALLDSPSLTGAYRFIVTPGEQTMVAVDARVFLREDVRKLGVAPLTSMFFFGENSERHFDDFRPEVHDSDGLLLNFASGEWLWRPLDNPRTLHVSQFKMQNPKGFGLIQRDRDFEHHQDLETRSELRPSVWVTPRGNWNDGAVELVEIPTNKDINDNIVAYWIPSQLPKPGEQAFFSYTMHWYGDDPTRPPAGRVVATRRDKPAEDLYRFVVDFAGKRLEKIPADRVLRGVVTIVGGDQAGELLGQHVIKNPVTGGWRLTFEVRPKHDDPLELRAFLDQGGDTLTETWSYVILP